MALLALGIIVAGLVFLYLWQGTVLARLKSEQARLILDLTALEREKLFLEHQVAQAYSPEVLSERAAALGMGPFDLSRIHYLKSPDGYGY